jgi:stage V sporulation protein S
VDRFFSKLDLRDIKIDPFKTSFPPDADEDQADEEPVQSAAGIDPVLQDELDTTDLSDSDQDIPAVSHVNEERQPHAPAWATPAPVSPRYNGHAASSAVAESVMETVETVSDEPVYAEAPIAVADSHAGEVLKVSARSRPSAVAGAIAGVVREAGRAEVQAIGAGATNQAVKAVAIARDYLRETGIEAVCLPAFIDVTIDNEDRTAIRLVVEPR